MNEMMKARVSQIQSFRDADGNLGKRIELVQDVEIPSLHAVSATTEEGRVVADVVQTMQQQFMPGCKMSCLIVPKIILFLTEAEYEGLQIDFNVNQIYNVALENKAIKFSKPEPQ
jgi:hypothetical protein